MKTNTIRHKIVGDTTIDEDTELHGMIAGTVTVAEDAILQLHGKVVAADGVRKAHRDRALRRRRAGSCRGAPPAAGRGGRCDDH